MHTAAGTGLKMTMLGRLGVAISISVVLLSTLDALAQSTPIRRPPDANGAVNSEDAVQKQLQNRTRRNEQNLRETIGAMEKSRDDKKRQRDSMTRRDLPVSDKAGAPDGRQKAQQTLTNTDRKNSQTQSGAGNSDDAVQKQLQNQSRRNEQNLGETIGAMEKSRDDKKRQRDSSTRRTFSVSDKARVPDPARGGPSYRTP